ncbi:MAG: hypothetical protein AAFQ98_23085, partial [Bacteroidota bacterium]
MHEKQENAHLKEKARENAKLALAASASFQQLNQEEQYQLYRRTVEDEYQNLAAQQGLSTGMRRRPASLAAISVCCTLLVVLTDTSVLLV